MILNKTTVAASIAAVVLGALMINPASAASKWSDISSVTNPNEPEIHTTTGCKESFSAGDLSAVTQRGIGGMTKPVGHISSANYGESDIMSVTHRNSSDIRHN